jgi:DNA-binding response OmpR family regulator
MLETIEIGGKEFQLELRTCTGGCGRTFKVSPSDGRRVALKFCETVCGKKTITPKEIKNLDRADRLLGGYAPTLTRHQYTKGVVTKTEAMTAGQIRDGSIPMVARGSKAFIIIENEYLHVSFSSLNGADSVTAKHLAFPGCEERLETIAQFLRRPNNWISREDFVRITYKVEPTNKTLPESYISRIRNMCHRNFGGNWFVPIDGGWKLYEGEIEYKSSRDLVPTRTAQYKTAPAPASNMEPRAKIAPPEDVKEITPKGRMEIAKLAQEVSARQAAKAKGTKVRLVNSVLSVGRNKAYFVNQPLAIKILEAFALAGREPLRLEDISAHVYGSDFVPKRIQSAVQRLRDSLEKQIPAYKWITLARKDGYEKFFRLFEGPFSMEVYLNRDFKIKMNETIRRQLTQDTEEFTEKEVVVNLKGEELDEVKATAEQYEEAVTKAKSHLEKMNSHRMAIAALCVQVCDIKHGGGNHWRGHANIYTVKKFAKDVDMYVKTLYSWVDAYTKVVSKLPPDSYDETDFQVLRRATDRVAKGGITDPKEVTDIYNEEKGRDKNAMAVEKIIKSTRYHCKSILKVDLDNVSEFQLDQLKILVNELDGKIQKIIKRKLSKVKEVAS